VSLVTPLGSLFSQYRGRLFVQGEPVPLVFLCVVGRQLPVTWVYVYFLVWVVRKHLPCSYDVKRFWASWPFSLIKAKTRPEWRYLSHTLVQSTTFHLTRTQGKPSLKKTWLLGGEVQVLSWPCCHCCVQVEQSSGCSSNTCRSFPMKVGVEVVKSQKLQTPVPLDNDDLIYLGKGTVIFQFCCIPDHCFW